MTDIQKRAKEIADKHNNDAYSVALAMLEESKVTQDRLLKANKEISRLSLENTFELHRIKADAVREWADQAPANNESEDRMVKDAYEHANRLERGEA